MSVVEKIALVGVVAVPISYVCSKRAGPFVQHALVACLWIVFLGLPVTGDMPIHTAATMMTAVLSFIVPLKLTQQILFPPPRNDYVAASKKTDDAHGEAVDDTCLSWKDFAVFVGSFLYYLFPISKTKPPLPSWSLLLKRNAMYLVIILIKITLVPLFELALKQLADKHPYPSLMQEPVIYLQMEVLFTLELIAMSWNTDIQSVVVNVASGGRLEPLYMHNYPFLSHSLRDLWGRRYNLLIYSLLKETVYIQLKTISGAPSMLPVSLPF